MNLKERIEELKKSFDDFDIEKNDCISSELEGIKETLEAVEEIIDKHLKCEIEWNHDDFSDETANKLKYLEMNYIELKDEIKQLKELI